MNKYLLALVIIACLIPSCIKPKSASISSQQELIGKSYEVGNFHSLCLNGFFDVNLIESAEQAGTFVVPATEELHQWIEIINDNGTINIGLKKGAPSFRGKVCGRIDAYFSGNLSSVEVIGSGKAIVPSKAQPQVDFTASITGSGDISLASMQAANLSLNVNGSGDIKAAALQCVNAAAVINGSGDIDIEQVNCNQASFSVKGSGDLDARAVSAVAINASVTGSGDIDVHGIQAESVSASSYGSGDVELSGTCAQAAYVAAGSGDVEASRLQAAAVKAEAKGSGCIYYFPTDNATLLGKTKKIIAK